MEHNEKEIDWDDHSTFKHCLYYSYHKGMILIDTELYYKHNTVYFTSEEIAKQAIQEIGGERLKKYYFEVNDNE